MLIERIREVFDINGIIVIGNADERDIIQKIKEICKEKVLYIVGMPLRKVISIISQCDIFIGNNSGPLHIASALKLPTVSMAGPTLFPLWLPYGEGHIVLKKELDCSPCNKGVCKDHRCMKMIQVEEVFEAVKRQIERVKELSN